MSKLNRDKLEEMTIVELKELLQKQGLSTSGNKQSLIERLLTANPGGAGVFVIEAVSAPRPKKAAPPINPEAQTPASEKPQLSEAEVQVASPEPTQAPDDAAALIAQLKDLVSQAQAAADAAQKAQQAAEAAAATIKQKKEKKGDKKKKDKKKKD